MVVYMANAASGFNFNITYLRCMSSHMLHSRAIVSLFCYSNKLVNITPTWIGLNRTIGFVSSFISSYSGIFIFSWPLVMVAVLFWKSGFLVFPSFVIVFTCVLLRSLVLCCICVNSSCLQFVLFLLCWYFVDQLLPRLPFGFLSFVSWVCILGPL